MMKEALLQEEYVRGLRREFHRHPEPSWGEERTASRVEEELTAMGIEHKRIAKTGVMAWIPGGKPGKTVALRADMDALEIFELNDLEFKSEIDGMMHGCGHDGHTAMLLGAAKILKSKRDELCGTVRFLFQPAEEYVQGAKVMIKDGCLDGVDGILGIHLWADLPTGVVSVEAGPRMASSDNFVINVKGKGGHGANPHQTIDAVVVGAAIVRDLQTIASRKSSPLDPVVVTIGRFASGSRFNVIAQEAKLEGTARCFTPQLRDDLEEHIGRIASEVAKAYRATIEMDYSRGVAALINDESCSEIAAGSVAKILSPEAVQPMIKTTGSEDMAEYLCRVPGLIAFVGTADPKKEEIFPHHNPKFDIDEDSLVHGTALYVQFAIDFLNNKE
jgi:amidohydrolase